MADSLDFSKSVQQIPESAPLAKPYERTVAAQTAGIPNYQGAVSEYAESTNWMSKIGSAVASAASNTMAQKLGAEMGKNPKGDLGVPITDFDRTMQESYKTQAQSTLGIQAYKLISDSNTELAKAPRITPDLIQSTQKNVSLGLQNIFKNAPGEIKPQLEYTYGHQQLAQVAQLNSRMIDEQKEDQKNNIIYSSELNAENAHSFGVQGNDKAALALIETTKRANEAGYNARVGITPEHTKVAVDTVRKSYKYGKIEHDYEEARKNDKGEAFLKRQADKGDKTDPDYEDVTQHLMSYASHQEALRSQDEQLRLAKFNVSIAKDVQGITGSQMQDLKENLSPIQYQKAELDYIKGMKAFNKTQGDLNFVAANWGDPTSFARFPEKSVNHGFDALVNNYRQQSEQRGNPITQDDAEVQVAASAGGKVPYFLNTLKNKINSANPEMMDSAARQIHDLNEMNAGHALVGLSPHDKGIITQFDSLRASLPADEAAKIAIENANQDPETQRMSAEKWSAYLKSQTGGTFLATAPTDWALKQVGFNKNDFMNPGIANEYGNMILQNYRSHFINLKGDKNNALKLAKDEADQNFGETGVNGSKFMTLHPIEKILGYGDHPDIVPIIQQDVMNKLNARFLPIKESFSKNEAHEYWETLPHSDKNQSHFFGSNYEPVKVRRVMRTGNTTKTDTYDVVLIGNSFNWDIALNTSSGIRPLSQVAPYLGMHTYTPDKKEIDTAYLKAHGHS